MNYRLYAKLRCAVSDGHKEQIESLLEVGASVNTPSDLDDCSPPGPLLSSVYLGDLEVVGKLLSKGASVNEKHLGRDTALTVAAKFERYAIVDLLLLAEGLENCHSNDNLSHLHIACMRNNVEVVKKLIQSKNDLNAAVKNNSQYWPGFTALHFAVQFCCIETVEYLLSIGADITIRDARKLTPLHLADKHRSEQIIDMILQAHTNYVSNPVNSDKLSHFHIACTRNNPEVVQFFIRIGVNLDEHVTGSGLFSGFSALELAVFHGCVDVVKLLLLNGDRVRSYIDDEPDNIKNVHASGNIEMVDLFLTKHKSLGKKPVKIDMIPRLHISCARGDIEAIRKSLSEEPANLNSLWNGCTPLHLAVAQRNKEVIKLLMNKGSNCSLRNVDGKSPLHLAFEIGIEFVNLILEDLNDFRDNPISRDGLSHLHIFCASSTINNRKPSIIDSLIKLGFDMNSPVNLNSVSWPGFTPFHFAVKFRNDKIIQILLSNGACYSAIDSLGLSAFDLCIKEFHGSHVREINSKLSAFGIMEMILSFHSQQKLHPLNDRGYSLLHLLSLKEIADTEQIETLIRENPSDLYKVVSTLGSPYDGYTPLHFAMRFGNQEQAEILIRMGANILIEDANGDTPLHVAFESDKHIEIVINLRNPDILRLNLRGSTGYTLFHVACGMGDIELMKYFLEYGIDANSPTYLRYADSHDRSPLHVVIQQNPATSVQAVKLLLDKGADVHARDSRMETPLHKMRCNRDVEIIDILVSRGADINALNANFETPILRASISAAHELDEVINEKIASFLNNGADINVADERGSTPLTITTWTDDLGEFFDTADTLLKHVLRLQTIGLHVSDANKKGYRHILSILLGDVDLNFEFDEVEFTSRCIGESEQMSAIHIGNGTTLRDTLSKTLNELAVISENDIFIQSVSANDLREKFPIYGPMLESQLRKGRARKLLLNEAQTALKFVSGVSLPIVCMEKIFRSFTNEDLKFLIVSKEIPNPH